MECRGNSAAEGGDGARLIRQNDVSRNTEAPLKYGFLPGGHSPAFVVLSEGLFIHFGLRVSVASYIGDTPALPKRCLKKKVVIINCTPRCGDQKAFRTKAFI